MEKSGKLDRSIAAYRRELESQVQVVEREIVVHDRRGRPVRAVVPVKICPTVGGGGNAEALPRTPPSFNKGRKTT